MSIRDQLLNASKRAGEVLDKVNAKGRVEDGYTRIDPFAIADDDELPVMIRPLEKLLGAFVRADNSHGILVNPQRPIGMVHLTCAHELGHYFLGHETKTDEDLDYGDSSSIDEQTANEFAYKLLMPRWLVVHVMKQKGWGVQDLTRAEIVYQLSLRLGVSFKAMTWTLRSFKFLQADIAAQLSRVSPKSIKEAAAPNGVIPPQGSDLWVLDPRDRDHVIEPRETDLFIVQLPSHTGAGYIWTADEASGAGFTIKPLVVDVSNVEKPSGPVFTGGSASMQYVLSPIRTLANQDQPFAIHLSEKRPWDAANTLDHLAFRARYETLRNGLSRSSRERLLREANRG